MTGRNVRLSNLLISSSIYMCCIVGRSAALHIRYEGATENAGVENAAPA